MSRGRARAAAREADLAKLKVKQLKEKAQLEAKIAAQKAQLEAELVIQEAEHEAGRKEIEALLLSAAPAKSGPLDFPSQKSFLLFFAHEKDLGHMFQK